MATQSPGPDAGRSRLSVQTTVPGRLDSWKEIAAHFGRDVRTVQRWEKTEGLPVRRHLHGKAGTVFALRAELDGWWENRRASLDPALVEAAQPRPRLRPLPLWLLAVVVLLIVPAALFLPWRSLASRTSVAGGAVRPIPGRLLAAPIRWIPVGADPYAVVASPTRPRVYVSNRSAGTVSEIRTDRDAVAAEIRVGGSPRALALTPDGRTLYVADVGGFVSAVDTATRAIARIPIGAPISDLALAPDGRRAFLALGFHGLVELSIPDHRLTPIPAGSAPMYLAPAPDGSRLYINYQAGGPGGRPGHDAIDVFDPFSRRFIAGIEGPPNVGGPIAVSPDGAQIWADGQDACGAPAYDHAGCPIVSGAVVNIIRASDARVVRTLGFAGDPADAITFLPDGSRAIVAGGAGPLRVLDTTHLAVVESLDLAHAGRPAFSPDGRTAWCPVHDRNAVAVFDLSGRGCLPAPGGLAAWWPGDDAADDLLGQNSARLTGAAYAPGLVGQAFRLGRGGAIEIGPLSYGDAPVEFTVAAWFQFAESAAAVIDLAGGPAQGWRLLRRSDGRLALCDLPESSRESCPVGAAIAGAAAGGRWTHLAIARAQGDIALFIDGVRAASLPGSNRPAADSIHLRFAAEGLVDEIQWFNRSLHPAEVRSLVSAGAAGICYNGATDRD